jgi:hypothetical protein
MTLKSIKSEALIEREIEALILKISRVFPKNSLEFGWQTVKQPSGVDGSRIADYFAGRPWAEFLPTAQSFPPEEIVVNLSPMGMICYLPLFMTTYLQNRRFGQFEEMLLPVGFGLEDVVRQFGDDGLEDPEYALCELRHDRVAYAKEHLTHEQRECVAQYIEIAETYCIDDTPEAYRGLLMEMDDGNGSPNPKARFQELLKKYTDFWRCT